MSPIPYPFQLSPLPVACNVPALDNTPELRESCNAGTITLQEMTAYAAENNEDVPFAFLNSKVDEVQISYYVGKQQQVCRRA